MSRLLRKLAQMSIPAEVATSTWRRVSDDALQQRGAGLYDTQLIPGFDETRGSRVLMLPSRDQYDAQVARGEVPHYEYESDLGDARTGVLRAKKTIGMLSKLSSAFRVDGEDGDFERYVAKETNPAGRDYSMQRDRDIQTGLNQAWDSNATFEPGSEEPPTSGKSPILERGPRHSKEGAARLKRALQSGNMQEDGDSINQDRYEHADLTDTQQSREIGEAHDALQFYAPHSPEGTRGNPTFGPPTKDAAYADWTPEAGIVEKEDHRGLPQWPHVMNDSRDSGQGDVPTSTAWAEHDSFNISGDTHIDTQGNPGPAV